MSKTKEQIVGELLASGKITSEEAVTLLTGERQQLDYFQMPYITWPSYPTTPVYVSPEYRVHQIHGTFSDTKTIN